MLATFSWVAATGGTAAELLTNGNFNNVLVGWTVPAELGSWLPYQHAPGPPPAYNHGTVLLHPDSYSYEGVIIAQSLNVTGIGGQSISAAIDLGADAALPAGKTIAVYVEYLDGGGLLQRQRLINPDNTAVPVGSLGHFTGSHTFPAGATKLVRLTIEKEDFGQVFADNVSLSSATLTPGVVPHVTALNGDHVAYGQTFTIVGSGFAGATAPTVLVNNSNAGLTVNAWSDTTVTVAVAAPAASGNLLVKVAGTPAVESRHLEITSPHYFASLQESTYYAVPGQVITVPVRVDFRNGFTTGGGVQIQARKGGVAFPGAAVAPNPVFGDGGTLMTIDTAGLTPGQHQFQMRPVHGGVNGIDSFFDIFLEVPASMSLSINGNPVSGTINLSQQGQVATYPTLLDAGGNPLNADPDFTWSTSNPSAFSLFMEDRPWSPGPALLVHNDGDGVLHANGPGGLHYQFPVHVDVPDSPRVTSCALGAMTSDNSGAPPENWFFFQANVPLSGYSTSVSDMGIVWGDGNWGGGSPPTSYTQFFSVAEGQRPGTFLFSGSSSGLARYAVLTVLNAASKGMVTGQIVSFLGGEMHMHEQVVGTLEFYDASTGLKVTPGVGDTDLGIWEWGKEYHAAYLDPGTYKVRWIPQAMGPVPGLPQWWPNAQSFAEAAPVVVTAGAVASGVHFFVTPADTPPSPPQYGGPMVFTPDTHVFSMPVMTENGSTYQLQRSENLLEGSWFNVGSPAWGNGAVQTLQDTTATGASGFYRVLKN